MVTLLTTNRVALVNALGSGKDIRESTATSNDGNESSTITFYHTAVDGIVNATHTAMHAKYGPSIMVSIGNEISYRHPEHGYCHYHDYFRIPILAMITVHITNVYPQKPGLWTIHMHGYTDGPYDYRITGDHHMHGIEVVYDARYGHGDLYNASHLSRINLSEIHAKYADLIAALSEDIAALRTRNRMLSKKYGQAMAYITQDE